MKKFIYHLKQNNLIDWLGLVSIFFTGYVLLIVLAG